jgi:hypothetical protein
VETAKGLNARRLHKAFLRYHDPDNWPLLREALQRMGRSDLIGNGKQQLIPRFQPRNWEDKNNVIKKARRGQRLLTQHTGLPPRETGSNKRVKRSKKPGRD